MDSCSLGGDMFVSPVGDDVTETNSSGVTKRPVANTPLDSTCSLENNVNYFLWRFDYIEGCPVYLGRQLRQTRSIQSHSNGGDEGTTLGYSFTLGFRPRSPNQHWIFVPAGDSIGDESEKSSSITDFHNVVQLVVCGWENRPGHVESNELHKLIAEVRPTHSGRPVWAWHTVPYDTKDTQQENLRTDLSFAYTTSHLVRPQRPESELHIQFSSSLGLQAFPGARRRKRTNSTMTNQIFPLDTFAIPDLSDRGAYLLYSPERWNINVAPGILFEEESKRRSGSDRRAIVEFSFWSKSGILYFKACCLPFALAIPVINVDREFFNDCGDGMCSGAQPIIHLFESHSARWGCIKYYMATAADVGEGCTLDLDRFMRGVTDHDDHSVEHSNEVIAIKMKNISSGAVDPSLVQDIPRDDSRRWKFFFSW